MTQRPPPFDPDNDLMADLEGSKRAVRAYRAEGDRLRMRDAMHWSPEPTRLWNPGPEAQPDNPPSCEDITGWDDMVPLVPRYNVVPPAEDDVT